MPQVSAQPSNFSSETIARVKAAIAAREQGRFEEAASGFEAVLRQAPQLAELHLNLGLVRHEQGRFQEAVESFSKALELKLELERVRGLLGFDLLQLGRAHDAADQLEKAREEEPDNKDVASWLGLAYLRTGEPDKAIPLFHAVLEVKPADADLLYYLGQAHARVSFGFQAELLRLAPDSARAHLAIAEDHRLNGREKEALAEYAMALERNPNLRDAQEALAGLYSGQGNHEAAVDAYEAALHLAPQSPALHYGYGDSLLRLGQARQAIPHLRQALELEGQPSAPGAHSLLGKALLDVGDLAAAEINLHKALSVERNAQARMRVRYHLAQLYRKRGDSRAAATHLAAFRALQEKVLSADRK